MSTLVIIGNGFDLWHRLPTKYSDFRDLYESPLEDFWRFFPDLHNDSDWSCFEEALGSFDANRFYMDVTPRPSLSQLSKYPSILFGYEDDAFESVRELIQKIKGSFQSWIYSIETDKVEGLRKIIELPLSYHFINFNYTSTLQKVYQIPKNNVFHIHGNIWKNIIFGHNGQSLSHLVEHESHDPWFDEARERISSIYGAFHKPVEEILERSQSQLNSYGNITRIMVIGHSISDIDKLYFQFILNQYPKADWENYNHISDKYDGVKDTHNKLIALGVPQKNITSAPYENLKTIYPIA